MRMSDRGSDLDALLACPICGGDLEVQRDALRCTDCGVLAPERDGRVYFVTPPADAPANLHPDPANPRRWSAWRKANFAYLAPRLRTLPDESVVVDLGAGVSQFRALTARFRHLVALDFYPYELVRVVADLTRRFPLRTCRADAVIASNVLEHIPEPEPCLAECLRILRPGGLLVGAVPFLMRVHQAPYDFHRFTHFRLRALLSAAGFTDVEVTPLGKPWDVLQSVQRHFFYYLLDTRPAGAEWRRRAFAAASRVALWMHRGLMFAWSPLLRRPESTDEFTEGYGFRARRPESTS